jgi:asparagine synthase (glutamine-hydrolysing)
VTVALNGDAGDENFAGYRRYVPLASAQRFDRLPASIRRVVGGVARNVPSPLRGDSFLYRSRQWLRRLSDSPEGRYSRRVMIFDSDMKHDVCDPGFLEAAGDADAEGFLARVFEESDASDFVDVLMDVDVNSYLSDCLLVKVDIATMAHGLEGRSPMLDHTFMEFAAGLPSEFKLRGTETKYLLKRAVADLLPAGIIDRPKKGFGVPLGRWFREDLREFSRDLLLDGRLAKRGYFKRGAVERLLDEHWRGVSSWQNQLWGLLVFELWHRMFIDERPSAGPQAGSNSCRQLLMSADRDVGSSDPLMSCV